MTIFSKNEYLDTKNPFLDRSWPNLGRKIAPQTKELTDSEISSCFWSIYHTFWQAFFSTISPAPVLLSELTKALRITFWQAFFQHDFPYRFVNLQARGEPSTRFPRGWPVKTARSCCELQWSAPTNTTYIHPCNKHLSPRWNYWICATCKRAVNRQPNYRAGGP